MCRNSLLNIELDNLITGYDFGPNGDAMAVIDRYGVCLVSDVNTNSYNLRFDLPMITHSGSAADSSKYFYIFLIYFHNFLL